MSIKLSEVMAIWEEMSRMAPVEGSGFCDLDKACEKVLGVENDISPCQPVEVSAENEMEVGS